MNHSTNSMKHFTMLIISVFAMACREEPKTETTESKPDYSLLNKASWILGSWGRTGPQETISETWVRQNDSVYRGEGYFISGKDTFSAEKITLEQRGRQVFYIPEVKDQNKGITFAMTALAEDSMVFENPEHEFPQRISYRKVNTDSIVAEISGTINGQFNSERFPMGRNK